MDVIPPHNNHPRLIALTISTLLIVTSVFNIYIRNKKNPDIVYNANETISAELTEADQVFKKIDTDKDGLEDWQETLWKTDTERADTDGDGTNDGEEVNAGRDPLVAGPDDERKDEVYKLVKNITPQKTNYTQKNTTKYEAIPAPKSQNQSLKEYGNRLGKILISYTTYIQSSVQIINDLIKKHDAQSFENLTALKQAYQSLTKEISEETPEPEISTLHDSLIENYESVYYEIQNIETYKDKGAIPADVWKKYNESIIAVGNNLIDIADLFKKEGVTFSATEPGSIFSF